MKHSEQFCMALMEIMEKVECEGRSLAYAINLVECSPHFDALERGRAMALLAKWDDGVDVSDELEWTKPMIELHGQRMAFDVSLNMTANDWQLYTSSFPKEEMEVIASMLNTKIQSALHVGGTSWLEVYRACANVLAEFRRYGSSDTEPRGVLVSLLRSIGMPDDVV